MISVLIQGQSTLTEQIRKSYSTNDLRVPDDSSDQMDSSISYIDDDDDDELGNYCYYCKIRTSGFHEKFKKMGELEGNQ